MGLPFWSQSMGNLPRCSDAMQNDVGLLPRRAMPMAGWMLNRAIMAGVP